MSDVIGVRFWDEHPLLAGLTANVIVVLLSVALLNEVLQSRSRRRWRVLAQYVMFELAHNARMIWIRVLEAAPASPADCSVSVSLEAGGRAVSDTARLGAAIRDVAGDDERRRRLYQVLAGRCGILEQFVVASWDERLLQHARVTARDQQRHDAIRAMTAPGHPGDRHALAYTGPPRCWASFRAFGFLGCWRRSSA